LKIKQILAATTVTTLVLLSALVSPLSRAMEVVVGTGSTSGVYYQAGRAICRLVNAQAAAEQDIRCQSLSTDGSIYNLKNLRTGELQLGVVQSDWQHHAYKGTSKFQSVGPYEELRALFSLHGEPFTVVARTDAEIGSFDDLKGKRVNIGNPGSGQRATMEVVMEAKGWDKDIFALANELPASQQSLALCHDRVQAMIYTVGHPNASVEQATRLCQARIVEVGGPEIDRLVSEQPYYSYTAVPGGIYPNNPDSVTTFGVMASVVTSAGLDAETVYAIVKAVFDNLDEFKKLHPAFGPLDPGRMVRDGLSAPLHEGAVRYFKEKKLL
jgi:TRAP transporter TAXI family solute receptor